MFLKLAKHGNCQWQTVVGKLEASDANQGWLWGRFVDQCCELIRKEVAVQARPESEHINVPRAGFLEWKTINNYRFLIIIIESWPGFMIENTVFE